MAVHVSLSDHIHPTPKEYSMPPELEVNLNSHDEYKSNSNSKDVGPITNKMTSVEVELHRLGDKLLLLREKIEPVLCTSDSSERVKDMDEPTTGSEYEQVLNEHLRLIYMCQDAVDILTHRVQI